MGVIDTLLQFLEGLSHDPVAYSIVFFLYAVAATVFLPIPVELGLFLSTNVPIFVNALVLGAGKAVGSMLVFYLGDRVGGSIFNVFSKTRVLRAFVRGMRWFVDKTRYIGLYFILSTPLMVDTIPVYIFSLFNQKGLMRIEYFALTNFFAGITRAIIVYLIFYLLGIKLT